MIMGPCLGELRTLEKPREHVEVLARHAYTGVSPFASLDENNGGLPVVKVLSRFGALKVGEFGQCIWGKALERGRRAYPSQFILDDRGHHPEMGEAPAPIQAAVIGEGKWPDIG